MLRNNKKSEIASLIFVVLAIAVAAAGVYVIGEGITGFATAQVTVTSIIECIEDGSIGNCALASINADDITYEQFRVGAGTLNRLNTSHKTTLPTNIEITSVEVCLAAYRDSTFGDDAGDSCTIIGGENATGIPTYTTAIPASQATCLNWSTTVGSPSYVCGNITNWILTKPDPKASAENLIVSFVGVESADNNVDLWIDWVYTNISYQNQTNYLRINNLNLSPTLNIAYFNDYNYTVNVSNSSQLQYVNLSYKTVNPEKSCFEFYVNGSCARDTAINTNMSYLSGTLWQKTSVRPDDIYPQIEFADDSVYWYNTRNFIDLYGDNYHIFKFTNNFTINANTSFWIEFDAIPKAGTNKVLQVYLFDNTTTISTFQTNWLNNANGEVVAAINPTDPKNHIHTANSSHFLVTLTADANGTIGTKKLKIGNQFWIVLYAATNKQTASWNLSYRNGSLCNTSNWWRGTGGWVITQQTIGCPDAHVHLARYNISGSSDGVNATACAKDINNLTNCTSRADYFGVLPNLPPVANAITNPIAGNYYRCPINITWNRFLDPNNDIVTYSVSLLNANGNLNQTIIGGLINNWYYWNCSAVPDGYYKIRVNGTDPGGLSDYTDMGENFTIDKTPSSINLTSPSHNAVDGDGLIYFNCLANDSFALKNVSLFINGIRNQTVFTNASSYLTNFTLSLPNGTYNWSCDVYDQATNWNTSQNNTLVINTTALPISTNYTGETTNWSAEPDLSNVCNAVLDNPIYDKIRWFNCVNAVGQNFDINVNLSYNFVEIIFGLHSSFNSSAEITIKNLTWDAPPLVYRDGILCLEPECSNVSYNQTTGTAIFNVTHFTNYTTAGNSQLEIWDETDPDKENLSRCPGESVKFYANYTKKTNGQPITGANCTVNFADSLNNLMIYNATSLMYEYSRSFSTNGTFDWNVTCSAGGFQTLTLTDTVFIIQSYPPRWSNNQTNIVTTYSPTILSYFNITWTDLNISSVWFESNYSGSPQNYTMNLISGNTTNGTYNYSDILPAGSHYWKSYANSSDCSQWNVTDTWNFIINKETTNLNLSASPSWMNINNTQTNVSCYADNNQVNVTLWRNTTFIGSSVGGIVSDVQTLAIGDYNYTCNNSATQNYTAASESNILQITAKMPATCSLTFNPTSGQTYPVSVNASCSCTNPETTAQLWRNGTNVTGQNNQFVSLAAGDYAYVCNASETITYEYAQDSATYTINQATTILTLTALPSWTETYGTSTTINCVANNNEVTEQLYVNGTPVTIPYTTTHAAGTYNYTCNATASQNYTAAETSNLLTINQVTSTCSLNFNPSSPQIYGTAVNTSCSCTNAESSAILYRNSTDVTSTENNQFITLAAGDYAYVCNITGTQNYTSASDSATYTINKATTILTLTALPSWTNLNGTETNVSCSANNNEINFSLYRNDTFINSSIGGLISDIQNLSLGTYYYVCNNSATQNYTSTSTSNTLTITDYIPPPVTPPSGGGGGYRPPVTPVVVPEEVVEEVPPVVEEEIPEEVPEEVIEEVIEKPIPAFLNDILNFFGRVQDGLSALKASAAVYSGIIANLIILIVLNFMLIIVIKRILKEREEAKKKDVKTLRKEGFEVKKIEGAYIEIKSIRKKTKKK